MGLFDNEKITIIRVMNNILLILIAICVSAIGVLLALPNNLNKSYKMVGLTTSGMLLTLTVYLCCLFDHHTTEFQFVTIFP